MLIAFWRGGKSMRSATVFAVCGILALTSGCGGTPKGIPVEAPGKNVASASLASRYPDAQYIVAEGVSTTSYTEAEAAARTEVSARVQSELSTVVTSVMGSSTAGGQTEDYQRLLSETTAKTSFAHAEMIRAEPTGRRLENGVYHGVAILSRAEAAATLSRDYEQAALDFRTAAAELTSGTSDLAVWTATLRRAETGFAKLSSAALALQAVTRREHAAFVADLALYDQAERQRATRLSAVRLGLVVGGDGKDSGRLAASLGGALARLGLTATPGNCPPGGFVLRLTASVTWEQGPFGPVCRLAMPGELVACDGGRSVARVSIDSKEFLGTHSRGRDQALAALFERVDEARLLPVLRRELAGCLPVAER